MSEENDIEARLREEWSMRLYAVETGVVRPWPAFRRVWTNARGWYRPRLYVLASRRKRQSDLF